MLCEVLQSMCGKFKFCFQELSGLFVPNIFDPLWVECRHRARGTKGNCILSTFKKGCFNIIPEFNHKKDNDQPTYTYISL